MRKFKSFLFVVCAVFFSINSLFAQTPLMNGGFEQWRNDTIYWDFDPFESTANISFFQSGSPNVTPVSNDTGGNAVRLETRADLDGETYAGTIWLGTLGQNGLISTHPYTEQPDSAFIRVRHDLMGVDTALFGFTFSLNGNFIRIGLEEIEGVKLDWHWIGIDLGTFPASPDSMGFLLTSGNFDEGDLNEGAWIEIDSILLGGGVSQLPNHGFENTIPVTYSDPVGWESSNRFAAALELETFSVTQQQDSCVWEGNSSLRLETILVLDEDTVGFFYNGQSLEEGLSGGQPIPGNNPKPDNISGFYKYHPVGTDTALAFVRFWELGPDLDTLNVLEYVTKLAPADSFEFFSIPVDLTFDPDSFLLVFASSDLEGESEGEVGIGSVLWLDQLMIDGVNAITPGPEALSAALFPNPANSSVKLGFESVPGQNYQIRIWDLQGRIMTEQKFQAYQPISEQTLATDHLVSGLYLVSLYDKTGKVLVSKRLQIQQP